MPKDKAEDVKAPEASAPESSTPEKPQKNGLTKEALVDLIRDTAIEAVQSQMQDVREDLNKQATQWMANIQTSRNDKDSDKLDTKAAAIGAARCVRALAFGKGDPVRAKHFCEKTWDDSLGTRVQKSLQAGDFTAGGAMIPPEFAAGIIELLRSMTIVRRANPRTLPMDGGNITLRKQTGTSTATYVGESQDITTSQPTIGQIVMTAKKLAAMVPISNDLLKFTSSPSADEWVRDDLVANLSVREDLAFLRDNGTASTPKGLRFWASPGNVSASNGTSATNIEDDFKDLINNLELADVRMERPVWFMSPRSKNHLRNLRDANGNLIFPEIRASMPTLYGWPVFVTTSIPTNLGGGTETEIYLVDMVHAVIGEVSGIEIAVDSSASYLDGSTLVSAFSRDETLMRAIMRHDFAMRHDEAVAVKNAVTWGA
jgi:HK97 family phage major capsid protein